MLLYIIRHAWAEERDENHWPDDSLRPLTKDGEKRFKKQLKRLADTRFAPELIASSPFVRCMQTAEIISDRFPGKPKVVPLKALEPSSDLPALLQWTLEQQVDEFAWVGHSPDVEKLLTQLVCHGEFALRFKKGAIAAVRFNDAIDVGQGELQWFATAKLLGE
jgi:phosphohistidine phosphatase